MGYVAIKGTSQFTGELGADIRVVDGVVDLVSQDAKDNIIDIQTTHIVDGNSIKVTSPSGSTYDRSELEVDSTNTLKTIVLKANRMGFTDNPVISIYDKADTISIQEASTPIDDQEYRYLFTPVDNGYTLKFWATLGTAEVASKLYYDIAIYEGDYVTGTPPLPTQGQPVIGNSRIQAFRKYDTVQADLLTVTEQYDASTDPCTAEIVPITGPIADNPLFIQTDPWCLLQYNQYIQEPNFTKVNKFVKQVTPITDITGDPQYDIDGSLSHDYNDDVTILWEG